MITTGAKVIAFQLGLVIAILTWIAFDGLPWSRPQEALVIPEITDQSVGLVSPIYQPTQRQDDQVDYLANDFDADQGPAFGDFEPTSGYGQAIATGGYIEPSATIFSPPDPADSIGILPEPVLWNDYYSPAYYQRGFSSYQPSQFIVVSNTRHVVRHGHSAHRGQTVRRTHSPRRMTAANRPQRRHPQPRVAPRMRIRHEFPRTSALSYGQVMRQRAANFSHAGRIAPKSAVPAQRSRTVQKHRARSQR